MIRLHVCTGILTQIKYKSPRNILRTDSNPPLRDYDTRGWFPANVNSNYSSLAANDDKPRSCEKVETEGEKSDGFREGKKKKNSFESNSKLNCCHDTTGLLNRKLS